MPLRNDLLNPISPDHPAGENLYYSPTYDKIKEARREEDDAPQGEWRRERKLADWSLVVKLCSDALATKTKDLQLAVWLAEAILRREGIYGLHAALDLTRGLIENFWDGLFPELEDGDAEFRASPLRWIGERNEKLEQAVRSSPLTKGGMGWIKIEEARKVGSEATAAESYAKQQAREEAIAEGKIPLEVFEKDFEGTPKKFYVDLCAEFDATLESLSQLSQVCDDKFGDARPSYGRLEGVLEEVRQMARNLLRDKREKDPDEVVPAAEPEPEAEAEPEAQSYQTESYSQAAAPVRKKARSLGAEPVDYEDAVSRIVGAAGYIRKQDPYTPASYLLLRGLRWGELRANGAGIDQMKLSAPPGEVRQNLKRAAMEGNWAEALETAETAMGMECGRGWLDLQRYAVRACAEMGYSYDAVRLAIIAELKALLLDYPQLPEYTMMDDTPTANAETLAWIKEQVVPPAPEPAVAEPAPEPEYQYYAPPPVAQETATAAVEQQPDVFDLALQSARSGRPQEGIEMLMREMMQEPSGRGRFQRRVQVAQLCLGMGNEAIALPILQEAAAEIERRKLEDWEAREVVAQPLGLLYRCLAKNDGAPEERQRLYSWLCRLDPIEAMKVVR